MLAGHPVELDQLEKVTVWFCEKYIRENPTCTEDVDTLVVLSFGCIMLSGDCTNPLLPAKKRMSKGQYLASNNGVANGNNLPDEFLRGMYFAVQAQPMTREVTTSLR
jgi:Sec7-like guanine-nucleotide exchange factor